jgi:hypothetical protein
LATPLLEQRRDRNNRHIGVPTSEPIPLPASDLTHLCSPRAHSIPEWSTSHRSTLPVLPRDPDLRQNRCAVAWASGLAAWACHSGQCCPIMPFGIALVCAPSRRSVPKAAGTISGMSTATVGAARGFGYRTSRPGTPCRSVRARSWLNFSRTRYPRHAAQRYCALGDHGPRVSAREPRPESRANGRSPDHGQTGGTVALLASRNERLSIAKSNSWTGLVGVPVSAGSAPWI